MKAVLDAIHLIHASSPTLSGVAFTAHPNPARPAGGYITYEPIDSVRRYGYYDEPQIRFNCWADDPTSALALYTTLITALDSASTSTLTVRRGHTIGPLKDPLGAWRVIVSYTLCI